MLTSIAIILMGKREMVALLKFVFLVSRGGWAALLAVPRGCLRFVIVIFPDHTHLLFLCLLCFRARLFICALWSPIGKGLTSWLSFLMSNC